MFPIEDATAIPSDEKLTYLCDPLLIPGSTAVLAGDPKVGKSLLALNWALAMAQGQPFLGTFATPHPVRSLILNLEDPAQSFRARLRGLVQPGLPAGSVTYVNALGLKPHEYDGLMRHAIRTVAPDIVWIDTLGRLNWCDENKAGEMGRFLGEMCAPMLETKAACVLIHHFNKRHWEDNSPASGRRLRGSTVLHSWGNSYVYMEKVQGETVLTFELRHIKSPLPVSVIMGDTGVFTLTDGAVRQIQVMAYRHMNPKASVRDIAVATGVPKSTVARILQVPDE